MRRDLVDVVFEHWMCRDLLSRSMRSNGAVRSQKRARRKKIKLVLGRLCCSVQASSLRTLTKIRTSSTLSGLHVQHLHVHVGCIWGSGGAGVLTQ